MKYPINTIAYVYQAALKSVQLLGIIIAGTAGGLLIMGLVLIPLTIWFDNEVVTPLTQMSLKFWGLS